MMAHTLKLLCQINDRQPLENWKHILCSLNQFNVYMCNMYIISKLLSAIFLFAHCSVRPKTISYAWIDNIQNKY